MTASPLANDSKARILVVDDDPFMQMQLRLFLQREGYEIWGANNGQEALALYADYHPDVVLLDAIMPVMDGFECCRQLTQGQERFTVSVLMITGLEDQKSVDLAFEVGATDFITKPIPWAVLRQRVKRLLFQNRLQRELEQANRQLQQMALMDGLTQINNRRYFDSHLEREWNHCLRSRFPLALILADVDFFKSYNDFYGHQAGDLCLKRVAKALEFSITRATDFVARYGGEEFAVVLPQTDQTGAIKVGIKMLENIRRLGIALDSSRIKNSDGTQVKIPERVTISLGLAVYEPEEDSSYTYFQLLEQADRCLYEAKRQGRDRLIYQEKDQWVTKQL